METGLRTASSFGWQGTAGILNIVLKKEKGGGFNGSFDVNAGYPGQAGVGANVNYRKGKVNWFANYGLRYRESPGQGKYFQTTERGSDLFIGRKLALGEVVPRDRIPHCSQGE